MSKTKFRNIEKFKNKIGTKEDIVSQLKTVLDRQFDMNKLQDHFSVKNRYLIVRNGIIDLRHFFAAMNQTLFGYRLEYATFGLYNRTDEDVTLLLGVGNEIAQCVKEISTRRINSCFSNEDLFSNRHGAKFGAKLIELDIISDPNRIVNQFRKYLVQLEPISNPNIRKLKKIQSSEIFAEAIVSIFNGIVNIIAPNAY